MSDAKPKNTRSKFVTTFAEYQWDGEKYALVHREGYEYDGPWALAHDVDAVYAAEDYRWRNDDGSITTATWIAAENTAVSTGVSPGDNVRLRVNFGETAGAAGTGEDTGSWTLQFKKNAGSWTTVGAATDVQYFDSTNLTNGTAIATGDHVLAWSGAGVAAAFGDENEDGVTPSQTWSKNFAEAEFSIKFHATNTADSDSITFRLLGPDASVVTFTNVPTITLVGASSPIVGDATIAVKAGNTDGEVADLKGRGELKKDPAETIAFSVPATTKLTATGELKKDPAETIAFSDAATLHKIGYAWSGTHLAPYGLPVTPYAFTAKSGGASSIVGTTSIAFSEVVDLNGTGDLAAAETIAFATVNADLKGTGDLAAATSIAFSEVVDLNGTGDLAAAASVAFSETVTLLGTGDLAAATSIDFSQTVDLNGTGDLAATASIAFSETVDLNGLGDLAAATSIDFTQSGVLQTGLQGSTSIAFSEAANLNGLGDLAAATSVAVSESGVIGATGSLVTSESIAFDTTVSLSGSGALIGAETVAFSESGTLTLLKGVWQGANLAPYVLPVKPYTFASRAKPYAIAPYVLPVSNYAFSAKQIALKTAESVSFSVSATLQGTGGLGNDKIRGATSIDLFGVGLWLEGKGQLQASESLAFGNSATINASLQGSESITFATTATLTADGQLQASGSLAFTNEAGLGQAGGIQGSTTVDFSASPNITMFGRIQAGELVSVSDAATLTATGSLAASSSVAFSESVTGDIFARMRGSTSIRFLNPGQLERPVYGSTSLAFSTSGSISSRTRSQVFAHLRWQRDAAASAEFQGEGAAQLTFQADASASMRFQASGTAHARMQRDATAIVRF